MGLLDDTPAPGGGDNSFTFSLPKPTVEHLRGTASIIAKFGLRKLDALSQDSGWEALNAATSSLQNIADGNYDSSVPSLVALKYIVDSAQLSDNLRTILNNGVSELDHDEKLSPSHVACRVADAIINILEYGKNAQGTHRLGVIRQGKPMPNEEAPDHSIENLLWVHGKELMKCANDIINRYNTGHATREQFGQLQERLNAVAPTGMSGPAQ